MSVFDGANGNLEPAGSKGLVVPMSAAVLSALILLGMVIASLATFGAVNDLPEYFAAVKLIFDGQGADIYRIEPLLKAEQQIFPEMGERGVLLYIPPFALPFLLPVAVIPSTVAPYIWTISLAFVLSLALSRLARYFELDTRSTLWLFAFAFLSGSVYESVRIGQIAPFMLLALAYFLRFLEDDRPVLAGVCLSVLLLKPQELLPIALYLLAAGKTKILSTLVGLTLVLALFSLALVGWNGYEAYFELLRYSAVNTQWMQPELSPTIRGQLMRLPGLSTEAAQYLPLIGMAMAFFATTIAGLAARKNPKVHFMNGLFLVTIPLGLLSTLHCHVYDFLLLLPSVVYLLNLKSPGNKGLFVAKVAALLSLITFMFPIYVMIHYEWLLRGAVFNPLFASAFVVSAIMVFVAWSLPTHKVQSAT